MKNGAFESMSEQTTAAILAFLAGRDTPASNAVVHAAFDGKYGRQEVSAALNTLLRDRKIEIKGGYVVREVAKGG